MPSSHDIKNFMRQVRQRQDERLEDQLATPIPLLSPSPLSRSDSNERH